MPFFNKNKNKGSTDETSKLSPEMSEINHTTTSNSRRSKYDSISSSYVELEEAGEKNVRSDHRQQDDNNNPESLQQMMHSFFMQPLIESATIGNWSGYWILGFLTSFAFFFPSNPLFEEAKERQSFGPWFKVHLICAFLISFICLFNIFHTPSQGPKYCVFHRWVGRVLGIIISILCAFAGIITAWWERYVPGYNGQGIALTYLAVMQAVVTIMGYRAIRKAKQFSPAKESEAEERKKHIENHRWYMLFLWVCCLAPAWFRIPQAFGASADSNLMFLAMIPANFWLPLYLRAVERKSFW